MRITLKALGWGSFRHSLIQHSTIKRAAFPKDARNMCRRLAREEGLLVGTSTRLNVSAAIALANELGPGKTVVTIACDTGLKYMNGNRFLDN